MIKLFDNGAYLLHGTELVEDNADQYDYFCFFIFHIADLLHLFLRFCI